MLLTFCFSGFACGVDIKEVRVSESGEMRNVENDNLQDVITKLERGTYSINLAGCINAGKKNKIETFNFSNFEI